MKEKIHLIMPMAGAGSRFSKDGYREPKPLIKILDKPFFYWSTMSIKKYVDIQDLVFIVLQQHIDEFKIDKEIKKYFPEAKIVIIPEVLNGAVLTCLKAKKEINDNFPVVFNDCDHIFYCSKFNEFANSGKFEKIDGALLTFKSDDPKFSYLELDNNENVIKTVEKQVVSNYAICGAYYFKNFSIFENIAETYLQNCQYKEFFVSGIYNIMAKQDMKIKNFAVDEHLAFGTPEEYKEAVKSSQFERLK